MPQIAQDHVESRPVLVDDQKLVAEKITKRPATEPAHIRIDAPP